MYSITMSNMEDIDSGDKPFTCFRSSRLALDDLTQKWLDERTLTFIIPGAFDDSYTLVGYRDGVQEFAVVATV